MKFLALLFILGTAVGNDRHYRVVTIDTPPYIYKTEGDEQRLSGFLIDVMDEMSGRLNFSYEVAEVADKRFGRPVDGRWNGMIGDLVRNDADIALAPLTITRERAEVVKFGRPFMDASISGIMKRPAPGQEMPISELSDLPASGLHYETFKGGSTYRFFVNSTDPMMSAIGAQMETTTFRENMADAIQRVTGEGGVFIGEVPGLAWVAGQAPCNLTLVGKPITSSDFALAFGNDFIGDVEAFNWEILGMKTDGTFNKLYTKHFQRQCEAPKLYSPQSFRDRERGIEVHVPDQLRKLRGSHSLILPPILIAFDRPKIILHEHELLVCNFDTFSGIRLLMFLKAILESLLSQCILHSNDHIQTHVNKSALTKGSSGQFRIAL